MSGLSLVRVRSLVVEVRGIPAPQGSKTALGPGRMRESSKAVGPWRQAIRAAAVPAITAQGWAPGQADPLAVSATFTVSRPSSHYGTGRNAGVLKATAPAWPAVTPDLDKLLRSTLDGLAEAGALPNDSRVVRLVAVKCYPGAPEFDALEHPGAVVVVRLS